LLLDCIVQGLVVFPVIFIQNAPDHELTPAEKQGFLAGVVNSIYPDGKEGLKINLKPSFPTSESADVLNV